VPGGGCVCPKHRVTDIVGQPLLLKGEIPHHDQMRSAIRGRAAGEKRQAYTQQKRD
jgi:hypothetical protein